MSNVSPCFSTHYKRKHYEIESHVTLLRVLREQRNGGYHCANVHGRYKGCWRQYWAGELVSAEELSAIEMRLCRLEFCLLTRVDHWLA